MKREKMRKSVPGESVSEARSKQFKNEPWMLSIEVRAN